MSFSLCSTAFKEGNRIPDKYTCKGQDVSPQLAWSDSPPGTQAYALIVDDPDAPGGDFTHWVLFNIPSNVTELGEAVVRNDKLDNGALHGRTDFGTTGYGGPCPPPGRPHHYRFTLYALDKPLGLKPGVSKDQVLNAAKGHILAQTRLTGLYQR